MPLSTEATQASKTKAKGERTRADERRAAEADEMLERLRLASGGAYTVAFTGEWREVGQLKRKQYGGWWWNRTTVALFTVDDVTLAVSHTDRYGFKATVVQPCSECGEDAYISDRLFRYENVIAENPFSLDTYPSDADRRAEGFREQIGLALRRRSELCRCPACNARAMQATCECCGRPH